MKPELTDNDYTWKTFGNFLKFGPHVYKTCLTKRGARRLAKRYNKKGKVAW